MTIAERLAFPARLAPADDDPSGLIVTFRDLPEAITDGEDERQVLARAADCLEEALAGRMARREGIPAPSRPAEGERVVSPGVIIAGKVTLYLELDEAGTSASELARRLQVDEKQIRQLLDPRHPLRLDLLEAAFAELGRRLVVEAHALA